MTVKLQIVAGIILILGLLWIVNMIRKRKLELKYALAWMVVIILMLLVDIFPPILSLISFLFGIATPVNTLFILGFIFALALLFILTVTVSRLSDRVRQLSQAVALNEKNIEELQLKELKNKKEADGNTL
ncbi:MAG: DUF2304 domain-containing protein [Lachnospiraceae bacterium]|nr:DUF2304 domain-containing protein [Lachnospiraceae bacterium]